MSLRPRATKTLARDARRRPSARGLAVLLPLIALLHTFAARAHVAPKTQAGGTPTESSAAPPEG